ncbi:MAG: polyprenyl synthetase family protein, partial [Thermoplasmata archaeon]
MDFAQLAAYRARIESAVRRDYRTARPRPPSSVVPLVRMGEGLTLRGGKRFRAILLLAGYHIASGRRPDAVVGVAAGLEHFQSWMLIHDDIIDHSEVRRGGPTVHRLAADLHTLERGAGSSEEYGVGIGITLGDLEEPYTVDSFLRARATASARLAALAEYGRMTRLTAFGQLLDIRNGTLDPGDVT